MKRILLNYFAIVAFVFTLFACLGKEETTLIETETTAPEVIQEEADQVEQSDPAEEINTEILNPQEAEVVQETESAEPQPYEPVKTASINIQPTLEEKMAAFDSEEVNREVEDEFIRYTWANFTKGEFNQGQIELYFDVKGDDALFVMDTDYSPLEECPFIVEDKTNEQLVDQAYFLSYKTYYFEDELGNDVETHILWDFLAHESDKFSALGVDDFDVYNFLGQFIEFLRDENWDMIAYIIPFPLDVSSPVGDLSLKSAEDFMTYRSYLFTKTLLTSLVNLDYGEIAVSDEGFSLVDGALIFSPIVIEGDELFGITSMNIID